MRKLFAHAMIVTALGGSNVCRAQSPQSTAARELPLAGRKVLMIVPSRDFRDEELKIPHQYFRKYGAKVALASSTKKPVKGMLGMVVRPSMLLNEVDPKSVDCVIFVGGKGVQEYFESRLAEAIAKKTVAEGKVLGAICLAPVILANAGLLEGKQATSFPSVASSVRNMGGKWVKQPAVRDGLIVTGAGPEAALPFARLVARTIVATAPAPEPEEPAIERPVPPRPVAPLLPRPVTPVAPTPAAPVTPAE